MVGGRTLRAEALRLRLTGLITENGSTEGLCAAICELLGRAIPFDYACLATTDPSTGLITGVVKTDSGDSADEEFARYEYGMNDDYLQFSDLVRRPVPVAVLQTETGGQPERSRRFREFLRPRFSHGHEMRAAFRTGGRMWGAIGLYRSTGPGGFTQDEADLVETICELVAIGLRSSLVIGTAGTALSITGPAAMVIDANNELLSVTSAAQQRIEELGGIHWGALPMSLTAMTAAARAHELGSAVAPRSRIRTASGQWLVVHAAALTTANGRTGDVVITLEIAGAPEIVPLVVASFGLTNREEDVASLVLQGVDTAGISRSLYLSPYTVQDHLKSIFAKAGVGSRRELTAKVFFEQYAPRIGSARGPDGWFR
ncbi:DNA-binding CsgD family transcriptional regulator [Nakamurella sp. UYEF19]|uniref:LuxR C-terminal-related transcriptional regulator n=1 Tax=Nakamurella sp. UYEF19 TaxID=1756392 RepID=UPI0033960626